MRASQRTPTPALQSTPRRTATRFLPAQADVAHPHNLDTLQRFDIVLEVLHRPTSASARAPLRPSLPASPAATRAADFAPAQKAEEGAGDGGAGAVGPVTGVEGVGLGGFGEPKKAQQQRPPTVGEAALQQVFGGEQWRAEQQERPQGQEELVPPPVGAQARRVEEVGPGPGTALCPVQLFMYVGGLPSISRYGGGRWGIALSRVWSGPEFTLCLALSQHHAWQC